MMLIFFVLNRKFAFLEKLVPRGKWGILFKLVYIYHFYVTSVISQQFSHRDRKSVYYHVKTCVKVSFAEEATRKDLQHRYLALYF